MQEIVVLKRKLKDKEKIIVARLLFFIFKNHFYVAKVS